MLFSTPEYTHPDTGFNPLHSIYEVDADEKAYTLAELVLTPPSGDLARRYQIIIVRRSLGRCQYIEDMGLAALWASGPKSIPSEWLHSVAELKDMADRLREIDMQSLLQPESEDLVQGFHDRVEEYFLQKRHTSVSGPLHRVERNGWPLMKRS